jgi:hypothetical protein
VDASPDEEIDVYHKHRANGERRSAGAADFGD